MALTIQDATTRAAVAAASYQQTELEALAAPFVAAGAVTAQVWAGATQLDAGTYAAWAIDTATPRGMTLGARSAYSAFSTGTLTQLLYEIIAHLGESSISGTTKTIKKIDGTTSAATFTLDSATTPTSITRAT